MDEEDFARWRDNEADKGQTDNSQQTARSMRLKCELRLGLACLAWNFVVNAIFSYEYIENPYLTL